MKKSGILKVGILLCSVTLATWFVAYRAGYFSPAAPDPLTETSAVANAVQQSDDPISANAPADAAVATSKTVSIDSFFMDEEMMVLASSKSGRIFYPDSPKKETPNDAPNQTFMGSSKNDGIFEPAPVKVDSPVKVVDDRFINSSKSGDVFRPAQPNNIQVRPNNNPVNQNANTGNAGSKPANAAPQPFMGSSKSAPIFQSRPDTNKPDNKPEHK